MARCPICGRPIEGGAPPRTENPFAPFCTSRCRQIDLGKWLNEDYRVPVEETSHSNPDDEEP